LSAAVLPKRQKRANTTSNYTTKTSKRQTILFKKFFNRLKLLYRPKPRTASAEANYKPAGSQGPDRTGEYKKATGKPGDVFYNVFSQKRLQECYSTGMLRGKVCPSAGLKNAEALYATKDIAIGLFLGGTKAFVSILTARI